LLNFKSAKHVHLFQELKTLGSEEPDFNNPTPEKVPANTQSN